MILSRDSLSRIRPLLELWVDDRLDLDLVDRFFVLSRATTNVGFFDGRLAAAFAGR